MSGILNEIYRNSGNCEKQDFLNGLASKTISEVSGLKEFTPEYKRQLDTRPFNQIEAERREAEIELSYIDAAIALAKGSNDIGAEVHIGPFTIGVSLNNRLIPLLEAEAEEIRKFLSGKPNNYEFS